MARRCHGHVLKRGRSIIFARKPCRALVPSKVRVLAGGEGALATHRSPLIRDVGLGHAQTRVGSFQRATCDRIPVTIRVPSVSHVRNATRPDRPFGPFYNRKFFFASVLSRAARCRNDRCRSVDGGIIDHARENVIVPRLQTGRAEITRRMMQLSIYLPVRYNDRC